MFVNAENMTEKIEPELIECLYRLAIHHGKIPISVTDVDYPYFQKLKDEKLAFGEGTDEKETIYLSSSGTELVDRLKKGQTTIKIPNGYVSEPSFRLERFLRAMGDQYIPTETIAHERDEKLYFDNLALKLSPYDIVEVIKTMVPMGLFNRFKKNYDKINILAPSLHLDDMVEAIKTTVPRGLLDRIIRIISKESISSKITSKGKKLLEELEYREKFFIDLTEK